jgi:hypothetical protein
MSVTSSLQGCTHSPCQKLCVGVADERERDNHGRVLDVLVVLRRLEVAERRGQRGAVGHHLEAAVDGALVEQRLEDPPLRLHEARVHGLVVVVEVDPAAQTLDRVPPLACISHHDGAALFVVFGDAELPHRVAARHAQLLVNLVLNGHAVRVPAESSLDIAPLHRPVARDDVLDGRGQQMAVMGQARCERRAIVEGVRLFSF